MESLQLNKTWRLEELPQIRRTVKNKWVFKLKCDSYGQPTRLKARLVAKGFSQRERIDYDETFSTVLVRHKSVRAILSTAAFYDLEIIQMDVKTAFLHGDLTEQIYMGQPTGFENMEFPDRVYRLQKSLYGLKQASRLWNVKFDGYLTYLGFRRSQADSCVYNRNDGDGDGMIILALWIDDGLLFGPNKSKLMELIDLLFNHLEITVRESDQLSASKLIEIDSGVLSLSLKNCTPTVFFTILRWMVVILRRSQHIHSSN